MNRHDQASDVVNEFIRSMKRAFNPKDTVQPPLGGGSTKVRFFAGDGALPSFEPHGRGGPGCKEPFLWVRIDRRYRSRRKDFPAAFVGEGKCNTVDVCPALAIEIGVARCTDMDEQPNWSKLEEEAEIGLDDSWRIELALCMAETALTTPDRAVATDTIAPQGPEGGLIAWTGMAYVLL